MNKRILGIICCITLSTGLMQDCLGAMAGAFVEHYNAAQEYLLQNQYSSAIVEFRKALRINFMDSSARIGVINSYLAITVKIWIYTRMRKDAQF